LKESFSLRDLWTSPRCTSSRPSLRPAASPRLPRACTACNRTSPRASSSSRRSLGTPLFHRHKRRLTLSAEGKLLLAYAERLLRLSSEAQAALRSGAPRGTLRIGSLESTAATRLPPVLSGYHAAYPEVRLELVTGTTGALVAQVLGGDIEAAFVAEPFTAEGLESLHAFTEELVLVSSKGFPRIRSAKEIGHTPILAFTTGCSYRRRLEAWLGGSGIAPEAGDGVRLVSRHHCLRGQRVQGSPWCPRSVIRAVRRDKELRIQTLPQEVARARTLLVWRKGHKSTALDAMQAEIKKR